MNLPMRLAGLFLIIEGIGSIFASDIQEPIWHVGRIIRIIIGVGIIAYSRQIEE